MNKYFLSLLSVLILIQGLRVMDEIFFYKDRTKNSYPILQEEIVQEKIISNQTIKKNEKMEVKEKDIDELLQIASIKKGKKISKQ